MNSAAAGLVALAFGLICLFVFMSLKTQAGEARGERRFYVIGFYRSVLLALGIVSAMAGISRLLSAFMP